MRTIQKTISLEPMTSRMPSVMPAYKDNILYFFDDDSLKERDYKFPSNYGMIPLNLKLSGVTFVDGILSAENGWDKVELYCDDEREYFTISFENLSNWYHFFKEYYHLLNDYGHCSRTYSSATEYYYYESGARYADQMIYGTDEHTYIDLDNEFNAKGGIVDIDSIMLSGATDIGFYDWICDNIVPSYYISKDYVDYWRRSKLYYPDVIKWIAWFGERLMYEPNDESLDIYSAATYDDKDGSLIEKEHWNCKDSGVTDCCDCEEYFNRGGRREYKRMSDWYNALQDNIRKMNDAIIETEDNRRANEYDNCCGHEKHIRECFIPTISDEIELQNSLEHLGQYTIFSKEYGLGIDYRTASYGDTENTHGGTVVEISGNTMILKDGYSGFRYNKTYMEKEYDKDAWDDYTQKYMSENRGEFVADGYQYYAYDNDNVMYTGNDVDEVKNKMSSAYTYDIISANTILIDDVLYDIQHSEYGIYDLNNQYMSGKTFFVYREKDTSTPYTLVNGKKVYAELSPYSTDENGNVLPVPCYYFTFFKVANKNKGSICGVKDKSFSIANYKQFGRKESTENEDVIDYITYEGEIYEVDESGVTINEVDYPRVSGYAYSVNNELMYCISGHVVDSEILEEIPKSSIEGSTIVIGLDYEPEIYKAKELCGQTISHLTDLEATNVLIDDIGNKIDGKYNPSKSDIYNHQPPQGTELELLYDVGNISNLRRFKLTAQEASEIKNNINYFVGNIITNMSFYYKDVEGNEVSATTVDVYIDDSDGYSIKVKGKYIDKSVTSGSTSLSAITASTSARTEIEKSTSETVIFDGDDIYCDVRYYIGATLGRVSGGTFHLAYSGNAETNNYNYGVEYNETVKFVKENKEYYLKRMVGKQIPTTFNSPSAHSVSYPIYVYKLYQEMKDIEADEYGTYFQAPIAMFKTEINTISGDLSTNYSGYTDMDTYNNIHVSPTFKQEYMLGLSSLENIDSDIYIERGINAAFEKHLKLGEVATLEALEQFGNGYFKIMQS